MPEHVIKIVLVIVSTLVRSAQLKEFLDKDFFELTFSWFRLFLKWHRSIIKFFKISFFAFSYSSPLELKMNV